MPPRPAQPHPAQPLPAPPSPGPPSDENDRSITGQIARALAQRIVAGVLLPGAPIRQDRVAEEFRASHVPVREAFRKLEAQGLVVSEPRRGVRVAPIDPAPRMPTLMMSS